MPNKDKAGVIYYSHCCITLLIFARRPYPEQRHKDSFLKHIRIHVGPLEGEEHLNKLIKRNGLFSMLVA